jgi:hypothetical protein
MISKPGLAEDWGMGCDGTCLRAEREVMADSVGAFGGNPEAKECLQLSVSGADGDDQERHRRRGSAGYLSDRRWGGTDGREEGRETSHRQALAAFWGPFG